MGKRTIQERLEEGVVVGDGGMVFALEKRGYVKAGPWTPEASVENPEAVKQLHREFLRCGADVLQTFTFYSSDEKLQFKSNESSKHFTCKEIASMACKNAREVADEGDALVAACMCQLPSYLEGKGKEHVQREVQKQVDIFVQGGVDFIICEFYNHVEEIEWAIEQCVKSKLPILATMCIGVHGDLKGVTPQECAVRMAKAGAIAVGVNCLFDPKMTLNCIKLMKEGLEKEGLNTFLMTQPNGFNTTGTKENGYNECPEFPFAMETRCITRFDVHKYTRDAYELGVKYIGGCCGFEPYHIRAIAEELHVERKFLPVASAKHKPWGEALKLSIYDKNNSKASREFWENMIPHSGRRSPPTYSLPDND